MKREEVIEIARMADVGFGNSGGIMGNCLVGLSAIEAAFNEVERRTIEKCVAVMQSYQIPYGNSAAGEIAAEMTLSMLREVRDEIRALANQQEKQND